MKESIIVLFFFSFGVLGGRLDLLPADWLGLVHEASNLAVYAMLAAVGMSLGFDSRAWRILRDLKGWVVLVPLMIIVGTFLGGVAAIPGFKLFGIGNANRLASRVPTLVLPRHHEG